MDQEKLLFKVRNASVKINLQPTTINQLNILKKHLFLNIYHFPYWIFLKLRFTPCKAEEPLQGMELQEKETQKDYNIQEICLGRTYSSKMSVNSIFKATYIISQKKAFYRQRTPESSRVRKETIDIDIFVTSSNGDSGTSWASSEEHLPNTYRKDLSWLHSDHQPRVQEKQQEKDQQYCIFTFVACLTIPSIN